MKYIKLFEDLEDSVRFPFFVPRKYRTVDEEEIKDIFNSLLDRYNFHNYPISIRPYYNEQRYNTNSKPVYGSGIDVVIQEIDSFGTGAEYLSDFDGDDGDEKNEIIEEISDRMFSIGYEYINHYLLDDDDPGLSFCFGLVK